MPCYFDPVSSATASGHYHTDSSPLSQIFTALPLPDCQPSASRQPDRHKPASMPPVQSRHKTAPLSSHKTNPLQSKHTATTVIIYNLQAPTSIDNPSIRHTVTKQTRHPPPPVQKQELDMCRDYTLNIISRADQDYTISCLLSRFCEFSICRNDMYANC